MPYEIGGRADKLGNRYELRWAIYQILNILNEKIDYVILEPIGQDEEGIDLWTCNKDGIKEGQQCKARNGSKDHWTYSAVKAKGIFEKWKSQLDRGEVHTVALVTPLNFTILEDLTQRAKTTNDNPKDFYEYQICTAGEDMQKFFRNFCEVMNIDPENEIDLVECISYLKRISIHQCPDSCLKELLLLPTMNRFFIGNAEEIYGKFVSWVVDGELYGKKIDQHVLYAFLDAKNILLRDLTNDERIMPRLEELNREYRESFIPLKDGLITRKEFSKCREVIGSANSIIVHGKAGMGKSGCTVDIINYCDQQDIPYLGIKLDKRTPQQNAEAWGKQLGLPASIAHCIHSISKHRQAVLILDQLDALRWTQAHSRDALLVCAEIINEVINLNFDRTHKISIVFVCRTYDLANDASIRHLFEDSGTKAEKVQWTKILVNELDEVTVKDIVGKRYGKLNSKLRELLKVPSNLYIWQQLDPSKEYGECSTTNHLVLAWWDQLSRTCFELGLDQHYLHEIKETVVGNMERRNRVHVPRNILGGHKAYLEFLSSNNFLIVRDEKVSFAHQSLLDCFLAKKMFERYHDGNSIVEIIGGKDTQTPAKRYQVQIFMESLYQYDSQDFLDVGQMMFEASEVRYLIKYVFLEVLSQADTSDGNIQEFVLSNCENQLYGEHLLNSVIFSRPNYIRLLRGQGVLDRWMSTPQKKDVVFNLLVSMSQDYNAHDIIFIRRYAFCSEEDDRDLSKCFLHNQISDGIDELFDLRMEFYRVYPLMANNYHHFDTAFKESPLRAVKLLKFLLENEIEAEARNSFDIEHLVLADNEYLKDNAMEVIDLLLPSIPEITDVEVSSSGWSGRRFSSYKGLFERACIHVVKQANIAVISSNPEAFLDRYKDVMDKGSLLLNEIILEALYHLPEQYSDFVVDYLSSDLEKNAFDKTSGNCDELLLVKQVLGKHSKHCTEGSFAQLEEKVIRYICPMTKGRYQGRINFKREHGYPVYWRFWGDFQKEILEVLPLRRLSSQARELIGVLGRSFPDGATFYKYSEGHSGWVSSPIAGKDLSDQAWRGVLTNEKLKDRKNRRWKEVPGGFLESSIDQIATSFQAAVSEEPERMIKLVLAYAEKERILEPYIDSLFAGVAFSQDLNHVPTTLLENMILQFSYDHVSQRARYICSIIEKRDTSDWASEVLDALMDIALNHEDPVLGKQNVYSDEDKEMRSFDMLQTNAINCVRGCAAGAIGSLLWRDSSLFEKFKVTIEHLVNDENSAVKFASLFALWPSYNIDKDWATEAIIKLYEEDYRLAGFRNTNQMLFLLYPKYRQRVIKIIEKCYASEDERIIRVGGHCLSEMYIRYGEFSGVMSEVAAMSETQATAIIQVTVLYINKDEFSSLAKEIILRFKTSSLKMGSAISRLFYDDLIDLQRDGDFLAEIMSSDLMPGVIHSFVRYLENKAQSVRGYSEIILSMSHSLIERVDAMTLGSWGLEDELSKLVARLYDETCTSRESRAQRIARECLDIWDLMFEKSIGSTRRLSRELMEM